MSFIKIDRQLFDHWLWDEKPYDRARAWIDLIGLANHKDMDFVAGNTLIHGKRGNVYRSKKWLADRWGWSEHKVRLFLRFLQNDKMISVKNIRMGRVNGTVITIENYGKYQDSGRVKERPKGGSRAGQGRFTGDIQEPPRTPKNPQEYIPPENENDIDEEFPESEGWHY